jgi:hypothetical protein
VLDAAVDGHGAAGMRAKNGEAADFRGYAIFPVEYADPEPSDHIARIRFTPPGRQSEEREIGINRPARYGGYNFCLVNVGVDKFGFEYAGLQMTREPGEGFFWAGALTFALSIPFHFFGKRSSGTELSGASESASDAAGVRIMSALVPALCILGLLPGNSAAFGTAIRGEAEWKGEVRIEEPVTVEKGGLLRILPGTTVFLSGEDRSGNGCRDGYIQVYGSLRVEGERGRPVRFTRLNPRKEWEEIFLNEANASISYAVFEGANWGLHIHGGKVEVEHSSFAGNGGGVRLKGTGATFSRCAFTGNGVGIRFWDGGPRIIASVIEQNGTGLFYREGSGGGKINGNMIANGEWNLKIGDWASGDLDASGNFWGDGGDTPEGMRVGDFRETGAAGRIVLSPVLSSPPEPRGIAGKDGT